MQGLFVVPVALAAMWGCACRMNHLHFSTHVLSFIVAYAGMALLSAGCASAALLGALPAPLAAVGPALVAAHILYTLPHWRHGPPASAHRR